MRKIGYFLAVILLGGILIHQAFFDAHKPKPSNIDFDFSDNTGTYMLVPGNEVSVREPRKSGQSPTKNSGLYVYDKLNAADGVYHGQNESFTSSFSNNKLSIKLGNGAYVLALTDLYRDYEISGVPEMLIRAKTPGYILIQNSTSGAKIYSYNAVLDIELLQGKKTSTRFNLLPSLLFTYDPSQNARLEKADIIRISTINSFFYVDARSPQFEKIALGSSAATRRRRKTPETTAELLNLALKDIQNENAKYETLTNELAQKGLFTIGGTDFIETYPFLFVNDSKKDAYLKNKLLSNLVSILKKEKTDQDINDILAEMKSIGDERYIEGKRIVTEFARILFYSQKSNENLSNQNNNTLLNLDKSITGLNINNLSNNTFLPLTKLYTNYAFDVASSKSSLENGLSEYLKLLLQKHKIGTDGLSVFSHFLSQYLTQEEQLSKKTFSIISYFVSLSQGYYSIMQKNDSAQGEYLKNTLYNYYKILGQLEKSLYTTYFENVEGKGMRLKSEYLIKDNGTEVDTEALGTEDLKTLVDTITKDLETKKSAFYTFFSVAPVGEKDNYMLTIEEYEKVRMIYGIFSNYPDYIRDQELNADNKSATKLVAETTGDKKPLSRDSLKEYLGRFNGVNLDTLRITNNFEADGYYAVEVNIQNSSFSFKLDPNKGNRIENIIFTDASGNRNASKRNAAIVLDEREKELRESAANYDDEQLRFKYDFRNFFIVVFLDNKSPGGSQQAGNKKEMTPQMKVFVQDNLINGDFTTIARFFPIPPSSIYATIENGEYKTELSEISKGFEDLDGYIQTLEFEGGYSFANHAFNGLRFSVKRQGDKNGYELGGYKVEILPTSIDVRKLEQTLSPILNYVKILTSNYRQGNKNLKIDLNSRKVYIDSQSFDVTY